MNLADRSVIPAMNTSVRESVQWRLEIENISNRSTKIESNFELFFIKPKVSNLMPPLLAVVSLE